MARPRAQLLGLPEKEALLAYIRGRENSVTRRDIAREFGLRGAQRAALRHMLRELEDEGEIERGANRRLRPADTLPSVTVIEVTDQTADGDLLAIPARWTADTPPPRIEVATPRRGAVRAPTVGDKLLARLRREHDGRYTATPMKRLETAAQDFVGVFHHTQQGDRVLNTKRGRRTEYHVKSSAVDGLANDDLVMARILPGRRMGLPAVEIGRRLGNAKEPHAFSLIAIQTAGIPNEFPTDTLQLADECQPPSPVDRTDLRGIPLITIDGADARDFDDAVFAEPDPDPSNKDGWHIVVAIADVAWYVRSDDALDREARRRGNSVYFPDRVVPMLPEKLSNGVCSLRPGEERACLAVHIWIGPQGGPKKFQFERGLMRSAARLTYEQVQAAHDGHADTAAAPFRERLIQPLFGAFKSLDRARHRRQPLDLDLPERAIRFDKEGKIVGLAPVPRLVSHRLIEEFMIAANVAAAQLLTRRNRPCLYRIHERPNPERIDDLRTLLAEHGFKVTRGQSPDPSLFNRILDRVKDTPKAELFSQLVLRAQMQATYSPRNIGHFGLALDSYAHFTSPIRRYADLMVHRSIIHTLGLGKGALDPSAEAGFDETGDHISMTERRAANAEREVFDRYAAAFLEDRVGAVLGGIISGISRAGLFVRLDETGADGLLPMSRLPMDYFRHDESRHALVGERTGHTYHLGDQIQIRLLEVVGVAGQITLDLAEAPAAPGRRSSSPRRPHRRRR